MVRSRTFAIEDPAAGRKLLPDGVSLLTAVETFRERLAHTRAGPRLIAVIAPDRAGRQTPALT